MVKNKEYIRFLGNGIQPYIVTIMIDKNDIKMKAVGGRKQRLLDIGEDKLKRARGREGQFAEGKTVSFRGGTGLTMRKRSQTIADEEG